MSEPEETSGHKKLTEASHPLATQSNLFSNLLTHLSKTVKRDEVAKNMVLLAGISAYTRDPINLFLRGESSTGKTYNTTEALKYFPSEDVWMLGDLSPKALVHEYGVLVDQNGDLISSADQPKRTADRKDKEVWKERLRNSRYIVDLRNKILVFLEAPGPETYHVLRPILSHDKEEISYKFTHRETLRTNHVVIKGWPATIFCSSENRYIKDLATRGFTVTPEIGLEKYRDANVLTGTKHAFPWTFKESEDRDFHEFQSYIRWLGHRLNDESIDVAVPYGEQLANKFPANYPRTMRDYKRILSLIEVYTLFHLCRRPVIERMRKRDADGAWYEEESTKKRAIEGNEVEKEYYVLPTREDFNYVLRLWEEIEETTVTGLPGHILKFYEKVVEPLGKEKGKFTIEELTESYNEAATERRSSDSIRKWVDLLCRIGWTTKEPHPKNNRRNLISVIKKEEKNGNHTKTDFSEFFGLNSFREWLEKAKKIPEDNTVLLKENILSDAEAKPEEVYHKYYLSEFKGSSDISSQPKRPSSPEINEEKNGKSKNRAISEFLMRNA